MTLLLTIAEVSARVAKTPSRLAKVREIADCLRLLERQEIPVGISFLNGEIRHGKLGIGYTVLREARSLPGAQNPVLTLSDVDQAFAGLTGIKGSGANRAKSRALNILIARAIAVEIAFNELQASSLYPGGLTLRFARVKGYRPDKRPEDADTIDTVRAFDETRTGRDEDFLRC